MDTIEVPTKNFEMKHQIFPNSSESFNETTAPSWLTGAGTWFGSTTDVRWFWNKHILTLDIGESIETDFRIITRIQ